MIVLNSLLFKCCLLSLTYAVLICAARVTDSKRGEEHSADRTVSAEVFNSLEELSRVVDVSYCVGTSGVQKPFECLSHCKDLEGFELVTTWNTGPFLSDSCGYIAFSHSPSPKRIIVAFRGTYSIANTVIDLSAYPQAYVPYDADSDGDEGGSGDAPSCLNCTVHAGFMTSWQNTRKTVLYHVSTARERYPDYKVVLVGHSLGGAVAALAGVEMQLRGWEPEVTTFGEPKVGNRDFARFVDEIFALNASDDYPRWKFRRVTHVDDPVPLLPLEKWGYEMHAGEIFISKADLSPSIEDLSYCDGDSDVRCISGVDEETLVGALQATDDTAINSKWHHPLTHVVRDQVVFSDSDTDKDLHQSRIGLPWHLIPAKYRLWELFFSHRDYFWRLGLCVPGGDPTGGSGVLEQQQS